MTVCLVCFCQMKNIIAEATKFPQQNCGQLHFTGISSNRAIFRCYVNSIISHKLKPVLPQLADNVDRFYSPFRKRIFHFRRNHRKNHPGNKAIGFKLTQGRREHFMRHFWHRFFQFAIPERFISQSPQNRHLPGSANPVHHKLNRIVIQFFIVEKFWHSIKY